MLAYPFVLCEKLLLLLVVGYDRLIYDPLQACLSPLVACFPRHVTVRGKKVTILTANGVSLTRTVLVVPIACCLNLGYFTGACLLILLHDFLDHLDGIVAKVQRKIYGNLDDPLLGGFMDAFCDKIVNVFTLWTILLVTNFPSLGPYQTVVYLGVCSAVIGYEVVLGVVRVQDYFTAYYIRKFEGGGEGGASGPNITAIMEGKLKEKLESLGLALLCLALKTGNPIGNWVGVCGIFGFAISLRFAHASLTHKLKARTQSTTTSPQIAVVPLTNTEMNHVAGRPDTLLRATSVPVMSSFSLGDSDSASSDEDNEGKVDKVYTIGCFDLFHRGHVNLFRNMRKLGREVIVGVHTDESIVKLKNRVPIDNTEKRMGNLKKYADQVFVVSSTDPSPYIRCCVHLEPGQTALYVRGDDMPHFPGRHVCEELMPIKLLPYTQGVSATMLRAQLLAARQDENHTDILRDAHAKEE